MVITTIPRYENKMQDIFNFIAPDRKGKKFHLNLSAKIKNLLIFTYIGRIRSDKLIYKGYVITYTINNNEISILGIYQENEWNE
ncbi:type II toxin-antitoxin system RelE/ParE family toxin [Campylobacter porcelli]|uniref:Putative toxin-antitoxin system, toxin component, RelE/ParE family n=1 Tax=Campylobacter porcelli TaxID=1660073 RepID=A0A1X9SXC3_9BACT|nr:type II toxin-antitoxin system RelE/ParE family toxin [Campylobacter sp. RM6137]ARR00924.1 putative toxin-antitoxin system, toxin component, RelE/ParE family [Campylobacter sp. RM6137]